MAKGLFIIGTDTEVGKTVVSAGLMYLLLKNKYNAGYFKPIASGEIHTATLSGSGDACFVKTVSGFVSDVADITPFSYKTEVSPHLAARIEGRSVDFDVVKSRFDDLKKKHDVLLVEGCGGLAVPLNDEGFMLYDLVRDLGLNCLLVARSGLGTINHTLLTMHLAERLGIEIKALILNDYSGNTLEKDNVEMLRKLTREKPLYTLARTEGIDTAKLQAGNLRQTVEAAIDIEAIVKLMDLL